ncbi:kinase-like protein [Periconia macrospinosa]|uniref:Kinase-like protein n=1 Tax=Periconia macrospinosa TaxID=97972 RepID=A0A2V1DNS2_9PLEO|nr:kinase-like protein [Periconia macrospinosa]
MTENQVYPLELQDSPEPQVGKVEKRLHRFASFIPGVSSFVHRPWKIIESENFEEEELYHGPNRLLPLRIGQLLHEKRYKVVGKLGWDTSGTTWLCQDKQASEKSTKFVTVKLFRHQEKEPEHHHEIDLYRKIRGSILESMEEHRIRPYLDNFWLREGPWTFHALVLKPCALTLDDLRKSGNLRRRDVPWILQHILQALRFLHQSYYLHLNITPENIVLEPQSNRVYFKFARQESLEPSDRKYITDVLPAYPIYRHRSVKWTNWLGKDRHCDAWKQEREIGNTQPQWYRAPEVILGMNFSAPADVWNLACVMANVVQDASDLPLVYKPGMNWSSGEHLLNIACTIGLPPKEMGERAARIANSGFTKDEYGRLKLTASGNCLFSIKPAPTYLEQHTSSQDPQFLAFLRGCLVWEPKMRLTTKQLLDLRWIQTALSRQQRERWHAKRRTGVSAKRSIDVAQLIFRAEGCRIKVDGGGGTRTENAPAPLYKQHVHYIT